MGPSVVTAVLLLVSILGTETAKLDTALYHRLCDIHRDSPCGDGWSRIDQKRCAKFIGSPKSFQDAQEHCRTLNSDLVSIHSPNEMINMVCSIWRATSDHPDVWIGATISDGEFKFTDGSKFTYGVWFADSDGQKGCIELNSEVLGYLNVAHCSQEKFFVCAKEM